MDAIHVAAALASAALHAGWNAAVKASARPTEAMTAQMMAAGLVCVPVLAWTGLPDPASWPWIACSTLVNLVTVATMLRAYDAAGFGVVYPVGRAVSVLMVVPLAALLAGERIGPWQAAGVAMVATSLLVLALGARRDRFLPPRALFLTLASGLGIAVYVMSDAHGVRASGSPAAYGCAASIVNGAVMYLRHRRMGSPWGIIGANWRVALPASVASSLSYLLILWVWSAGPIAPGAALRDVSAIFAILISVWWLKEPFDRTRLAAVALAAVAVPLLRIG